MTQEALEEAEVAEAPALAMAVTSVHPGLLLQYLAAT